MATKSNFRFTPESGLKSDIAPCRVWAKRRLMHRSNASSFVHAVGAVETSKRQSFCCMCACISCKALGVTLVSPMSTVIRLKRPVNAKGTW
jgi:hypothetical protein